MDIGIDSINIKTDITTCRTGKEMQAATKDEMHIQDIRMYILDGWPSIRNAVKHINIGHSGMKL